MGKAHIPNRLYKRALSRQRKRKKRGLSPSVFECAAEIWSEEKGFVPDVKAIRDELRESARNQRGGGGWLGF